MTDSAGIRIVESLAPVWGQDGTQLDVEPVLRIGSSEETPYQFSMIYRGRLLDDGHIAVGELMTREIRIFDSTGRHVRTFGGKGDGPGEFDLVGMLLVQGDSIGAYDQGLRRMTIFSRVDGGHRTVRTEVEGNFTAFGQLGDGRILLYNPGSGYRPDLEPGLQWDTTDVVAMDPADGSYRIIRRLAQRQQWVEPDGNTRLLRPAHWSIHATAEDGFYWATTDRYDIRFYGGDGTLRRILRRPVEPQRVDQQMIDAHMEATFDRARRTGGEASVARWRQYFEDAEFGEHVPLFGLSFVDRDGRLWVSESSWPVLAASPRQWSVFGEDGAWLGDLEVPEGMALLDSRGDTVLAVWLDSLDVPYVQLHRLIHRP